MLPFGSVSSKKRVGSQYRKICSCLWRTLTAPPDRDRRLNANLVGPDMALRVSVLVKHSCPINCNFKACLGLTYGTPPPLSSQSKWTWASKEKLLLAHLFVIKPHVMPKVFGIQ
jgi:hypothetical protein